MKTNRPDEKPLLLFFPFAQQAHYLRCLMLARTLQSWFEIRFAAAPAYDLFMREEGFSTFRCSNLDATYVTECAHRFSFEWLQASFLEPVYTDQVATIEKLQPFAVVGDTSVTLKMAAEKTGVPFIALMNTYTSSYYRTVRTLPQRHPLYKFLHYLPQSLLNPLIRKGELMTYQKIHRPFAEIRKKEGLMELGSFSDEMEGDCNLLCDLPQLFPVKALPPHYHLLPPLFYVSKEPLMKPIAEGPKTVFVSMGSSGTWKDVAFLNHPRFHAYRVITAGDCEGVINGPHVQAEAFVDARAVLPAADLVICHGGNGTIYQALSYGVPVLCKTTHFEQEWNVQALEECGLGQSLDQVTDPESIHAIAIKWMALKGTIPFREIQNEMDRLHSGFHTACSLLASQIMKLQGERKMIA